MEQGQADYGDNPNHIVPPLLDPNLPGGLGPHLAGGLGPHNDNYNLNEIQQPVKPFKNNIGTAFTFQMK